MKRPNRPLTTQDFVNYSLTVKVTPTPLNSAFQQASIGNMYDAMIISVPKAAANPVYWGGRNVSAAPINGLEIPQGVPLMLSINNDRQLYEIQAPLVDGAPNCEIPEGIPFVVWNPSNIYLIAPAQTVVGVVLFMAAYI